MTPVQIPKFSLAMEEGKLVRWLKKEGQHVEKDEILLEVETDKSLVELPSPATGTLRKILVHEGTVPVERTIAYIGDLQEAIPEEAPRLQSQPSSSFTAPEPIRAQAPRPHTGPLRATPAARRRALELGIDLSGVQGTGPEGRITQEDVEAASRSASTAQPASENLRAADHEGGDV